MRSIEYSDVCIFMIDATEGIRLNLNIFIIEKNRKGVVVLVNKWDLIDNKDTMSAKDYEDKVREQLAPFRDVPILLSTVVPLAQGVRKSHGSL